MKKREKKREKKNGKYVSNIMRLENNRAEKILAITLNMNKTISEQTKKANR